MRAFYLSVTPVKHKTSSPLRAGSGTEEYHLMSSFVVGVCLIIALARADEVRSSASSQTRCVNWEVRQTTGV